MKNIKTLWKIEIEQDRGDIQRALLSSGSLLNWPPCQSLSSLKQKPGTSRRSPTWLQVIHQCLSFRLSSAAVLGTFAGSWIRIEQLELEPVLMRDTGTAGSGLNYCATELVPKMELLYPLLRMHKYCSVDNENMS